MPELFLSVHYVSLAQFMTFLFYSQIKQKLQQKIPASKWKKILQNSKAQTFSQNFVAFCLFFVILFCSAKHSLRSLVEKGSQCDKRFFGLDLKSTRNRALFCVHFQCSVGVTRYSQTQPNNRLRFFSLSAPLFRFSLMKIVWQVFLQYLRQRRTRESQERKYLEWNFRERKREWKHAMRLSRKKETRKKAENCQNITNNRTVSLQKLDFQHNLFFSLPFFLYLWIENDKKNKNGKRGEKNI